MEWSLKHYSELNIDELYDILSIRSSVFVVEQSSIYHDVDGVDKTAIHLTARDAQGICAYARIMPPEKEGGHSHIGRICVRTDKRKGGLGRELVARALELSYAFPGAAGVAISAPVGRAHV